MALVRGLTKRIGRNFEDKDAQNSAPTRAFSTRRFGKPAPDTFDRTKISLPLELVSASNALVFEAPSINGATSIQTSINAFSPASSQSSADSYQDFLSSPGLSSSSSVTSNENSTESSPICGVAPNHLTSYFADKEPMRKASDDFQHSQNSSLSYRPSVSRKVSVSQRSPASRSESTSPRSTTSRATEKSNIVRRSRSNLELRNSEQFVTPKQDTPRIAEQAKPAHDRQNSASSVLSLDKPVPALPQRALSHTKRAHQVSVRQRSRTCERSQTRDSNQSSSSSALRISRESVDMFSHKPEADHPFGAELQKVNELAEEFSTSDRLPEPEVQILDEESQWLVDNGFQRLAANDYISEIQPLYVSAFGPSTSPPSTWL